MSEATHHALGVYLIIGVLVGTFRLAVVSFLLSGALEVRWERGAEPTWNRALALAVVGLVAWPAVVTVGMVWVARYFLRERPR